MQDQKELELLLTEKKKAIEQALLENKPSEEASALYKEVKELQYQLTLLRNNLPIPA